MYKEASRRKLRFSTNVGLLSTEQLWDLSLENLDKLAVALEATYDSAKNKSFLVKTEDKNKTVKLQFDIVFDILQTKVEEQEKLRVARETKESNKQIMELIAKKQAGELEGKSIAELTAMLK